MPLFSGSAPEWGGTLVEWAFYGGDPPAYPAALDGGRAPLMLGYLPAYYEPSPTVRAMLQAEGYELDALWALARSDLPTVATPDSGPLWTLAMWERTLGLPSRAAWPEAARRRSIANHLAPVRTEAEAEEFIAGELRLDAADVDVIDYGAFIVWVAVPEAGQVAGALGAARKALPAHLELHAGVAGELPPPLARIGAAVFTTVST